MVLSIAIKLFFIIIIYQFDNVFDSFIYWNALTQLLKMIHKCLFHGSNGSANECYHFILNFIYIRHNDGIVYKLRVNEFQVNFRLCVAYVWHQWNSMVKHCQHNTTHHTCLCQNNEKIINISISNETFIQWNYGRNTMRYPTQHIYLTSIKSIFCWNDGWINVKICFQIRYGKFWIFFTSHTAHHSTMLISSYSSVSSVYLLYRYYKFKNGLPWKYDALENFSISLQILQKIKIVA